MAGTGIEDGVRAIRLAAFSVAATVLALGAHVLAGGAPPAVLPTAAAVALPAVAAAALTRRRRGLLETAVVLGAVQLALHEVFAAAAIDVTTTAGMSHAASGHGHGAVHHASGRPLGMALAHVVAVLLTAVLLTCGEQLLHLLVQWCGAVPVLVGALLARGLPVPVAPGRTVPAVVSSGRPVCLLPSYRAAASVVRRGPPVPVC